MLASTLALPCLAGKIDTPRSRSRKLGQAERRPACFAGIVSYGAHLAGLRTGQLVSLPPVLAVAEGIEPLGEEEEAAA